MRRLFRSTITRSDRRLISEFLLDGEKEVREYELEISRLRIAMDQLENKKEGLKRTMENCRSLLSPVHRLPMEILVEIFSSVCEDGDLNPFHPPQVVQLSRVCGRWREVALAASNLWSNFSVGFADWNQFGITRLQRLAQTFVDRSHGRLTHVALDFEDTDDDLQTAVSAIMDILAHTSVNWRHLSLYDLGEVCGSSFLNQQMDLSGLQDLRLHGAMSHHPAMYTIFKNSPSLKTLEMFCESVLEEHEAFDLPWHQIETLKIQSTCIFTTSDFLALFPRLKSLYLVQASDQIGVIYGGHVVSNTVESVHFSWEDQDDANATLHYLTLPHLTSLTMHGADPNEDWSVWVDSPALDFLTRSACRITSLCLQTLPMTDLQVIALLQLMPDLTSLKIEELRYDSPSNRIVTKVFLQHLTVDYQAFRSSPFLPRLTDVEFVMLQKGLAEQDLVDAISSRWIPDPAEAKRIGVACLASVRITALGGQGGSDLSSPRCFSDAGMRL
ncbi:hypothetical protein V5O48_011916 [Marasmius crinis-equi]|uniref:F-box domain-containing protein n=1 Tax=Marasmius crinis-equi TaxID=585013 RepID=A0ABR3F4E9_9AGAR